MSRINALNESLDSVTGLPVANKSTNGAAHVTDHPLNYVTYADATYTYYCQSAGGSALADAVWQIMRKTNATGTVTYAGTVGTFGSFGFSATSLAVVGALTYNGGVTL